MKQIKLTTTNGLKYVDLGPLTFEEINEIRKTNLIIKMEYIEVDEKWKISK